MMTARAGDLEGFVVGEGDKEEEATERMQGMPKARVLPDPVSATPITSRPESAKGQAEAWTGVGDLKAEKEADCEDLGR